MKYQSFSVADLLKEKREKTENNYKKDTCGYEFNFEIFPGECSLPFFLRRIF